MIVPLATMDRRIRSGDGRPRPVERGHDHPSEEAGQLPLVMEEIATLMGASGSMLTLHASNGEAPATIYAGARLSDRERASMLQLLAERVRGQFEDGQLFWRETIERRGAVLLMPIDQLDGHGRLVISMFFDEADPARRAEAERLYVQRRPFAVGFFQLWQQNRVLQQRVQSFESVLDQTAIGVVMLNRAARIVFANQTAEEILASADGIGRSNGALRAASLADGVNLQAAISHALSSDDAPSSQTSIRAPLIAFRRKKGPPLVATLLSALSAPVEQGDVAVVMYLVDPQIDTEKMLSPLCRLYGLSPVETVLVCHLAGGATIASAAERMHVKEPTARSYLKTVFIKTATRRQTELVALILSSLIRMKRDVMQEALTSSGSERALGLRS